MKQFMPPGNIMPEQEMTLAGKYLAFNKIR